MLKNKEHDFHRNGSSLVYILVTLKFPSYMNTIIEVCKRPKVNLFSYTNMMVEKNDVTLNIYIYIHMYMSFMFRVALHETLVSRNLLTPVVFVIITCKTS